MRSKRLRFVVPFVLVIAGGVVPGFAEEESAPEKEPVPILWVVEGETPFFFFGTTTFPDARLANLPPVVEKAVAQSDVYVSEAPLDLMSQMKVQAAMRLPGGKTLASVIGEANYARVKKLMPAGIPEMLYRQFSPFAVIDLLEMRTYAKEVMRGTVPVEMTLHQRFRKAKKKTVALETIEEQKALFDCLTLEEQATFLGGLLDRVEKEVENGRAASEDLIAWYLAGDYEKMSAFVRRPSIEDTELEDRMVKVMLDDRQARMVERLEAMRREAPDAVHFVALGASHFGGESGLLKRLEKAGWALCRVASAEDIPAPLEPTPSGR